MKQIIKRILREQEEDNIFLDKISTIIEKPYFKELENYGINDTDDQKYILKKIYGFNIKIFGRRIYDSNNNLIHYEDSDGFWISKEFDSKGNQIYSEDNDGVIYDKRNITESKVIKEQRLSYNEKVSKILEPPYIHNMEEQFGVTDHNDQLEILKYIYGNDIRINHTSIFNSNFNEIYFETSNGYWIKREFNSRGDQTYNEDINGEWKKFEYDSKGNNIFYEDNDGYWCKYEYDSNGYLKYSENSDGLWSKYEFDSNGNETYSENSNGKWFKREYDSRGNRTYIENNNGYWEKREYDSNDNCIYSENSRGAIEDYR